MSGAGGKYNGDISYRDREVTNSSVETFRDLSARCVTAYTAVLSVLLN